MKGHMQDGKFHPHTQSKGVRKSRDQKAKTQGIRKQRHPQQEHVISDLRKTKSYWQVVLENPREESGTTTHIIELGKMANKDDVINALMRMQKDGHFMYFPQDLQPPYLHTIERLKRDPNQLPKEVVKGAMEDLGGTDVEVESFNPKWKLYEVFVDEDRYYFFPDEESAIAFGRQSIRDTATDYIPDKGTEKYDEYKNLDEDELVEKIIEEQGEFGQLSELGAVAKSVSGYDGQFHDLPNGWIAFRID